MGEPIVLITGAEVPAVIGCPGGSEFAQFVPPSASASVLVVASCAAFNCYKTAVLKGDQAGRLQRFLARCNGVAERVDEVPSRRNGSPPGVCDAPSVRKAVFPRVHVGSSSNLQCSYDRGWVSPMRSWRSFRAQSNAFASDLGAYPRDPTLVPSKFIFGTD
jgi:hypothetical protein